MKHVRVFMSSANGKVKFLDGLILYCEYNGTADVMFPALWNTKDEVLKYWKQQPKRVCNCRKDEPVEMATDYGGGFSWEGKACRYCMAITDHRQPFDYEDEQVVISRKDELPNWW